MTIDLAAIKAAAEKATPGPWSKGKSTYCDGFNLWRGDGEDVTQPDARLAEHDADFIALANPAAVLAMVRVCEAAKAFHEIRTRTNFDCPEMWAGANAVSDALRGLA